MGFMVGGNEFDYRFPLTSVAAKVPGALSNNPNYFDFANAPAGFHSHAKSDMGDVRITDASHNILPFEKVYYTQGSSIGEGHFKGSLSGSGTKFYAYYGNPGLSQPAPGDAAGSYNVWDSNFEFVHHEHLFGSPGNYDPDSTSNALHATNHTNMSAADQVAGKLSSNAFSYNGTDELFFFPTGNLGSGMAQNTIGFWIKSSDTNANVMPFGIQDFATNRRRYNVRINPDLGGGAIAGAIFVEYYDDEAPTEKVLAGYVNADVGMQDGTWHHVMITMACATNTIIFYIDGVAKTTTYQLQQTPATHANFTRELGVGAYNYATGQTLHCACELDEIRMSRSIIRSADYDKVAFNQQSANAAFWTVGAEETPQSITRTYLID